MKCSLLTNYWGRKIVFFKTISPQGVKPDEKFKQDKIEV